MGVTLVVVALAGALLGAAVSGGSVWGVLAGAAVGGAAGNLIGTDTTGLLDRGNGGAGIYLYNGANTNTIGGDTGWLFSNWAWSLRGLVDRIVGGPGLRRGRRHPSELELGDAIDFWRIERVDPPHLLRLRAEMKVPGKAWLQFEAIPEGGGTRLVQTAYFAPTGFLGWAYWYGIYPMHVRVFKGMLRGIARQVR